MIDYSNVNYFTENNYIEWLSSQISNEIEFVIKHIKEILLHPIEAKKRGIKFNEKINNRNHAFFSTINLVIKNHTMNKEFSEMKILNKTDDKKKMLLSCDYFALISASILRYKGYKVRLRTGFAKYIVPDTLIPHWVIEVYLENKWKLIDPDLDIIDLDRNDFVFAGEAWLNREKLNYLNYSGFEGKQGIKFALLNEMNCMIKNEFLGYHWRVKEFEVKKPKVMFLICEKLSKEVIESMDKIAIETIKDDIDIKLIISEYLKLISKESIIVQEELDI